MLRLSGLGHGITHSCFAMCSGVLAGKHSRLGHFGQVSWRWRRWLRELILALIRYQSLLAACVGHCQDVWLHGAAQRRLRIGLRYLCLRICSHQLRRLRTSTIGPSRIQHASVQLLQSLLLHLLQVDIEDSLGVYKLSRIEDLLVGLLQRRRLVLILNQQRQSVRIDNIVELASEVLAVVVFDFHSVVWVDGGGVTEVVLFDFWNGEVAVFGSEGVSVELVACGMAAAVVALLVGQDDLVVFVVSGKRLLTHSERLFLD